jgi:hypothetical protein
MGMMSDVEAMAFAGRGGGGVKGAQVPFFFAQ